MNSFTSESITGRKAALPDRRRWAWRWVMIVVGAMQAGGGFNVTGGPGYLSAVGPPPLRFRVATETPAASFVLPPLIMSGAEAMAGAQAETAGPAEASARGSVAVADPADPELAGGTPTAMELTGPADEMMTGSSSVAMPTASLVTPMTGAGSDALALYPQYFLKYFEGTGTNRTGVTVVTPVTPLTPYRFIPPEPVVRGESRATYRVQPHP